VRALLELGADPNGGSPALSALLATSGSSEACRQIAALLLQHGADCLLPADNNCADSLLLTCARYRALDSIAALLLADLDSQLSGGLLWLGSAARACQLLLAAVCYERQQLFSHSLQWMEAHFAAADGQPTAAEVEALDDILRAAIDDDGSSSPASLQALLASGLPFNLLSGDAYRPLLVHAAISCSDCAAKVKLLVQAGAPLTGADWLLALIDMASVLGVESLLAAGTPAVEASQPCHRGAAYPSYRCPIHRTLHLVRCQLGLACAVQCGHPRPCPASFPPPPPPQVCSQLAACRKEATWHLLTPHCRTC
jgi:hypothetical protein